jgi:uncharacterized membrane protein
MTRETTGREEIEIDAPLEEVYRFRLDCANMPQLNAAVRNVKRVDGGTGSPGTGTSDECDVDLEWASCFSTVDISEAVFPSLIVLDMATVPHAKKDDPAARVRSNEIARFSALPDGGTRIEVELTLYPPDEVSADEFAAMEANAGAPINVELAAMKLALEYQTR